MEDGEICISTLRVDLVQNGNTLGTTESVESLQVSFESETFLDEEDQGFMVIKTNGWSVDSVEQLASLLNAVADLRCGLYDKLNGKESGDVE
jgi:hypothetical protein